MPLIAVALRSRAYICSRLIAEMAGSNPAEGVDIRVCVCCVGSGLCDGLITSSEESYRAVTPQEKILSVCVRRVVSF
jgi:hypothetical protein